MNEELLNYIREWQRYRRAPMTPGRACRFEIEVDEEMWKAAKALGLDFSEVVRCLVDYAQNREPGELPTPKVHAAGVRSGAAINVDVAAVA